MQLTVLNLSDNKLPSEFCCILLWFSLCAFNLIAFILLQQYLDWGIDHCFLADFRILFACEIPASYAELFELVRLDLSGNQVTDELVIFLLSLLYSVFLWTLMMIDSLHSHIQTFHSFELRKSLLEFISSPTLSEILPRSIWTRARLKSGIQTRQGILAVHLKKMVGHGLVASPDRRWCWGEQVRG